MKKEEFVGTFLPEGTPEHLKDTLRKEIDRICKDGKIGCGAYFKFFSVLAQIAKIVRISWLIKEAKTAGRYEEAEHYASEAKNWD